MREKVYRVAFVHSPENKGVYSLTVDSTDRITEVWNDSEDEEVAVEAFMNKVKLVWKAFPLYFRCDGKYGFMRAFLNQLRKDAAEEHEDDSIWLLEIRG